MIKNYFTIALRILRQNAVYVTINLLSLGFAIACCVISYINFSYTRNFDSGYKNTENIYRVNSIRNANGSLQSQGMIPPAMTESLEKKISGIEQTARLYNSGKLIKHAGQVFHEQLYYADKNLLSLFNFPLKYGSLANFNEHSVIIGETFAAKYFGEEIPVGKKIVTLNSDGVEEIFTVSAVLEMPPVNSSFQFEIVTLFSNAFKETLRRNDWSEANHITTFLQVKGNENISSIEKSLSTYTTLFNRQNKSDSIKQFYLQPFSQIALTSDRDFSNFVESRSMKSNPRGVVVIVPIVMSLLIVMITCFNFINISISFSNRRLKEIGMRKVFGGVRKQLIIQFLFENIILCILAATLAAIAVAFLLPLINARTGFDLAFNFGSNAGIWIFLIGLPLVLAVFSGMYPALLVSAFKPLNLLHGKTGLGSMGGVTKFLLGAQFVISCIALIVGIILTKNADYQQHVDYGYSIDDVIVVQVDNIHEYKVFTDLVREKAEVERVAGAAHQIAEWNSAYPSIVENGGNTFQAFVAHVGGDDYMKTMGLRLTQGRPFHEGNGLDADQSVIVNRTFVQQHHLEEPLGKQVRLDSAYFTIIGVMEDYKQLGLHGLVPPCVLRMARPDEFRYVAIKSKKDLRLLNSEMEKAWNSIVHNKPYRAFLQSDVVSKERDLNSGFKTVAVGLALITIILSGSGLFALVSLNIIKRRREIAMRKVLGASVTHLILLMNKDLLRIVIISFVLGSALGYLLVDKLIFQFILVYHTDIGFGSFLLTLAFIMVSCALTVGLKVYSAATSNPVDVLKNE